MAEIRIIDKYSQADINIKNEPFEIYGKMIPSLTDGNWEYKIVTYAQSDVTEMTFPDEDYDFEKMSKDCVFVGAYEKEKCVGLAIWQKEWHKYLYLYDLKVNRDQRGKGIGAQLIEHGKRLAEQYGHRGIYTVGQDNNLNACRFYLKCGFEIGGFNDHVYNGTSQQGKGDIYFYCDVK